MRGEHQPRQNYTPNLLSEDPDMLEREGTPERGETKEGGHEIVVRKSYQTPNKAHQKITSISPKRIEKSKSPENPSRNELEPVKKPYANYLVEVRKKRIEEEKKGIKVKYAQWEKHLKAQGVSHKEKVMNILDDVNRIEHQVKMKEEKLKSLGVNKHEEPFDLQDQVGDMYLQSIRAKLAILKDF